MGHTEALDTALDAIRASGEVGRLAAVYEHLSAARSEILTAGRIMIRGEDHSARADLDAAIAAVETAEASVVAAERHHRRRYGRARRGRSQ